MLSFRASSSTEDEHGFDNFNNDSNIKDKNDVDNTTITIHGNNMNDDNNNNHLFDETKRKRKRRSKAKRNASSLACAAGR